MLRSSGLTHKGMARKHNEDCFEIDPERQLFVVADGMGGHSYGEVASRIAVDSIRDFVLDGGENPRYRRFADEPGLHEHSNLLRNAVRTAHQQVLHAILQNHALQGMGTTVVGVLVQEGVAALAHDGDSRAYRLRNDKFELLTEDHTWVHEQVTAGFCTQVAGPVPARCASMKSSASSMAQTNPWLWLAPRHSWYCSW